MPPALQAQIGNIVAWAEANRKDAARQAIYFWSLKVPVAISAGAYGALSYFNLKSLAVLAGAVASVCALFEGFLRPGQLYKFYRAAQYELMSLSNQAWAEWNSGILKHQNGDQLAAKILDETEAKKQKISEILAEAASTLGGSAPAGAAKKPQ